MHMLAVTASASTQSQKEIANLFGMRASLRKTRLLTVTSTPLRTYLCYQNIK